jgi:glycosyltransferase involved in cell wall biosynthesis
MPRVSICLPCLNGRRFLVERLDTILAQTFKDWELIVVDGYSDDGSWELFQEYAAREPRMRLFQMPREGIYAGINACIERALGEFIYIATADDTMTPDCLTKLVAALDAHPECGICHCGLRVVDERGDDAPPWSRWKTFPTSVYFGEMNHHTHVRYAPHDGLLHYAVFTVYTSLTQLLIRRDVFDRCGMYEDSFGSYGDFEWGMRVSLLTNTVHVPEILATWRQHPAQATRSIHNAEGMLLLLRMSKLAWSRAQKRGAHLSHLSQRCFERRFRDEYVVYNVMKYRARWLKVMFLVLAALRMPVSVLRYVMRRAMRKSSECFDWQGWIRRRLERCSVPMPMPVQIRASGMGRDCA